MVDKEIRVLLAKPGLDGHDRGIKVIAWALRDAGMEVVYMGLFQTPENIAAAAAQEDVDVIGLSCMHRGVDLVAEDLMNSLKQLNAQHIPVVMGGVIPVEDIPTLQKLGVREVFPSESSIANIVESVKRLARQDRG